MQSTKINTIVNTNEIKTIGDLLKALETLEHVCSFEIVRGSGQSGKPDWKCSECGKIVKSS